LAIYQQYHRRTSTIKPLKSSIPVRSTCRLIIRPIRTKEIIFLKLTSPVNPIQKPYSDFDKAAILSLHRKLRLCDRCLCLS
jgi:hypothetical protein